MAGRGRTAPIRRDYLPEDLEPLIRQLGVDRTIFVQTQHNVQENRWVLGMAEQHEFIAGVVGWVDLASEKCEEQLLEFKVHPKFVGIRHVTHDEPDDEFIVRPNIIRGLRVLEKHGVPFDLLFFVKHLKHATTLARKLPGLRMVVDHLAKPRIKDGVMDDWIDDFRSSPIPQHLLQIVGHDHRGRLGELEARRPETLRRCGVGILWPKSMHVRF